MSIKYFAIGLTSAITSAAIFGLGNQHVILPMLIVLITFWLFYLLYLALINTPK